MQVGVLQLDGTGMLSMRMKIIRIHHFGLVKLEIGIIIRFGVVSESLGHISFRRYSHHRFRIVCVAFLYC